MASKYGVYGSMLTGDWQRLGDAFAHLSVRFPQAVQSALEEEGEFYRKKILEGLRTQAPGGVQLKPLSPLTIALRKLMGFAGTKALIRTGELRNAIMSVPMKGAVFVGILWATRGSDGRKLAEIGRLNEYGGVVRSVISRQRMRLIALALRRYGGRGAPGSGGGVGFGMVRIPPRPFLQPIFSMYSGRRGAERFMARVARKCGGMLGVLGHPDLGGRGVETIPERLAAGPAGNFAKGLRQMRTGSAGGPRPRVKMSMARTAMRLTRNPGARLKAKPRLPARPKVIAPRPPRALQRTARKAAAPKAPRVRATRVPRKAAAPKAPAGARQARAAVRRHAQQATRQNRAATAFTRRNQAAAARGAKQAQAQAGRQLARAQKQRAGIQKKAQTKLNKIINRGNNAASRRMKAAGTAQTKRQAKMIAPQVRKTPKARAQQHDAHVRAHKARGRAASRRTQRAQQHDAHVRHTRNRRGQKDAHVRAYRATQKSSRKVSKSKNKKTPSGTWS